MTAFDDKALRHRRIARGEERYGEGPAGMQARRFYLGEMLDEVVARAEARSDVRPRAKVDLLISLSGFTPITTIIAFRLLRPVRLLVISSASARTSIDVIGEQLVQGGRLHFRNFKHESHDPTDPLAIYRAVKLELDLLDRSDTSQPYAVIDITGGRKVMSAAAALAAWQLQLDICYLEADFDPRTEQPVPGSDRLLLLDNPTTLFGEQELSAASQLFDSGAFGAARARYGELCETLAVPGRARFMRALSDLYEAWCELDLPRLAECIEAVERTIANDRREVAAQVEAQLEFLSRLVAGDADSMLICFWVLGEHYHGMGRRDFAALLFYRTIEGCLTRRLESRAPGFDCAKADYARLTDDAVTLRERYAEVFSSAGTDAYDRALPRAIGLMDAAYLLTALDDPLPAQGGIAGARGLSSMRNLTTARNRSILAHGFRTVDPDQCRTFQARSAAMLRAYWALAGHDEDARALCRDLRFVRQDG